MFIVGYWYLSIFDVPLIPWAIKLSVLVRIEDNGEVATGGVRRRRRRKS